MDTQRPCGRAHVRGAAGTCQRPTVPRLFGPLTRAALIREPQPDTAERVPDLGHCLRRLDIQHVTERLRRPDRASACWFEPT